MKMYYYRGKHPNFGDELNVWMWPRLLPDFFDDDKTSIFLGIGSILYNSFPKDSRKIVFGSGYGGYSPPPEIDEMWKFYFVRGKLTAKQLRLDDSLAVGDAAILLRSCGLTSQPKRYKVSFMPHWESAINGAWADVCRIAGVHYVDPTAQVDDILADILASHLVVTEAMHGAIVADALRVPWVPVRPIQPAHRPKWFDWSSAIDLSLKPKPIASSNAFESALAVAGDKKRWPRRVRRNEQRLRDFMPRVFQERAAASLNALSKGPAQLSDDVAIERAHSRMLEELDRLRADHETGSSPLDQTLTRDG